MVACDGHELLVALSFCTALLRAVSIRMNAFFISTISSSREALCGSDLPWTTDRFGVDFAECMSSTTWQLQLLFVSIEIDARVSMNMS